MNGDVYSFGDARFQGNAPASTPVVGIAGQQGGYRLVVP